MGVVSWVSRVSWLEVLGELGDQAFWELGGARVALRETVRLAGGLLQVLRVSVVLHSGLLLCRCRVR